MRAFARQAHALSLFRDYAGKALPRQGNLFQSKNHMPGVLWIWLVCNADVLPCVEKGRPKAKRRGSCSPLARNGVSMRADNEMKIE